MRLAVYAVPQVLAATLPVGLVSAQMGTFVKLARVPLLLGPIVVTLSFAFQAPTNIPGAAGRYSRHAPTWVPWFVPAFPVLAALRSAGAIQTAATAPIAAVALLHTMVSMVALGLNVDLRLLVRIGPRIFTAVTPSPML